MAIYLGSNKQKMTLNNVSYFCNVNIKHSSSTVTERLLSSDGYVLKDVNGVALTAKKGASNF